MGLLYLFMTVGGAIAFFVALRVSGITRDQRRGRISAVVAAV